MSAVAALIVFALATFASCHRGEPPDDLDSLTRWGLEQLAQSESSSLSASAPPAGLPRLAPETIASGARLIDTFRPAFVTSGWKADAGDATPVLVLGPADRGSKSRGIVPTEVKRPGNEIYRGVRFLGFAAEAADVGVLEIDAEWGAAREIVVLWGRASSLSLPLPRDPDLRRHLRIPLVDVAEWRGPISSLSLLTRADAADAMKIQSVRLLPRAQAYPLKGGRQPLVSGTERHDALYVHAPAIVTWPDVATPAGGRFSACIEVSRGAELRVVGSMKVGDTEWPLFDERIGNDEKCHPVRAALPAVESKVASLQLRFDSEGDSLVWVAAPQVYVPTSQPRRVIVYLIDTFGAMHSSLYGYHRATTPTLEALGAQGAWFANAFANGSRTVESVTTLMTGLPAASHGVINSFSSVADDVALLSERFRGAGFATLAYSTNVNAGPRQGLDRGFDLFLDHMSFYWEKTGNRTIDIGEVMEWLKRHADRDVFLYIHTAEPHAPYTPPPEFSGRFDANYVGSITGGLEGPDRFERAKSESDVAHVAALYDEEVAFADGQLGAFVERLRAEGLDTGLTLAVTADHGEEFREHGAWTHGAHVYAETTRIPLVLIGPDVDGGRVDTPVQLMDLPAALLALAGITEAHDGGSIAAALRRQEPRSRDLLTSTFQPTPAHHALLRYPWRLVYAPASGVDRPFHLFNVDTDIAETRDVLGENLALGRELIEALARRAVADRGRGAKKRADVDPAQLEQLRALGYAE